MRRNAPYTRRCLTAPLAIARFPGLTLIGVMLCALVVSAVMAGRPLPVDVPAVKATPPAEPELTRLEPVSYTHLRAHET